MFGVRPSLALNTAIHADAPDTVVRVILEGFRAPEGLEDLGAMPAFLPSSRRRADRRPRRLPEGAFRAGATGRGQTFVEPQRASASRS